VSSWSVDAPALGNVLKSTANTCDLIAEQFYGSAAVGGRTAGVGSWDDRITLLSGAAGFDQVVVGAFANLINDQMKSVEDALGKFQGTLQSTHDAAMALVNGDESMAAAVVKAQSSVVSPGQPGVVA